MIICCQRRVKAGKGCRYACGAYCVEREIKFGWGELSSTGEAVDVTVVAAGAMFDFEIIG